MGRRMHWIALQPDEAEQLTPLGWQALQFSPKVARVALNEGEEALLMEISASERLFGGQQALLRQIYTANKALGSVKYAQAATSLIALAKLQIGVRARLPESDTPVAGSVDRALTPICNFALDAPAASSETPALPLHTLAAARPHLATLARIGCTRWGELRALPRGGVVRRFGAALLDALDRAYGLKPEIYPWLTLPEVFETKIELLAQVETAPALMFGAQRLFKQLQLWLQLRHCGVAALEFGWTMDARRNVARNGGCEGALALRTAEATQDIAHLQRLLGENLARLTLPAPVLYLSLRTLETEPLAGISASLLLDEAQKGDDLHQMVERLCARLGADNVLHLRTQADHRPEFRQKWILVNKYNENSSNLLAKLIAKNKEYTRLDSDKNLSIIIKKRFFEKSTATASSALRADALYPTWLLQEPLALAVLHGAPHYQGPLTLLAGPDRLETGWWGEAGGQAKLGSDRNIAAKRSEAPVGRANGLANLGSDPNLACPALRDYFIAQSGQGELLWVFRERLGERQGANPGVNAARGADSAAWYLHGRFD